MSKKTTIFYADCCQIFRNCVQNCITEQTDAYQFIGSADTLISLFKQTEFTKPDILMISYRLYDTEVIKHLPAIKKQCPNTKIIMYSMAFHVDTMLSAFEYVDGFIGKNVEISTVLIALQTVTNGEKYILVT